MAYFEYGYVNTGYDTNSDVPQGDDEESLCTFHYDISDVVYFKISNFNYNVYDALESKLVNFNYDVFDTLPQKIYNFPSSIEVDFNNKQSFLNYNIEVPIFLNRYLSSHYNVGDQSAPSVRIVRKDEND